MPSVAGAGSWAASAATRAAMQGNRRRDTRPEIELRKAIHRRGLRYRVDRPVPGLPKGRRIDIVFGPARVAVFVDGCFWHGCPVHYRRPEGENRGYWSEKVARNLRRDRETDDLLAARGWLVRRIWEHEDVAEAAVAIEALVRERATRFT